MNNLLVFNNLGLRFVILIFYLVIEINFIFNFKVRIIFIVSLLLVVLVYIAITQEENGVLRIWLLLISFLCFDNITQLIHITVYHIFLFLFFLFFYHLLLPLYTFYIIVIQSIRLWVNINKLIILEIDLLILLLKIWVI